MTNCHQKLRTQYRTQPNILNQKKKKKDFSMLYRVKQFMVNKLDDEPNKVLISKNSFFYHPNMEMQSNALFSV